MAIKRTNATDVSVSLKLSRDNGKTFISNKDGDEELGQFILSFVITEGLDMSAIYAEIAIQDSAGLIDSLTGSETWILTVETGNSEAGYAFTAYNIDSRARSGNSEAYVVECVSLEFLLNESKTLFGSSEIIFENNLKAKDIVEKVLKDLPCAKNIFCEDSLNDHNFIATHWRPFDALYWIAKKSIRPGVGGGAKPQNAYLFWENRMGFHFKSIDKIIGDVNNQSYDQDSNASSGVAKLYQYRYEPKKMGDEESDDFRIDRITFPEDRNYLKSLRNGSWSGYSVGFDPTMIKNSKLSNETPNASGPEVYNINDYWNDMTHMPGDNPVESYADTVKNLVTTPRRIRYDVLPNRLFDPKGDSGSTDDRKQYDEIVYLQAYQYLRLQSFKNIRLIVVIPGNVDLYSGYGIDINIPRTKPKNDKMESDEKYSGKYVIAGIRHMYNGQSALNTELLLYRDSLPKPS